MVRQLGAFGVVGLAATLCYAVLAIVFERGAGLAPVAASFAAYGCASLISYGGHRRLTFASSRPHAEAVPRFALLTLLGVAVALAAPQILTVRLGLPSLIAVAATCIAVPLLSYLGLDRLVFRGNDRA